MRTALKWFKSSYSADQGNCIEVAYDDADTVATATIHIRDSKNPTGPLLSVNPAAWAAFTRRARHGAW
ncbi:DUF397 domain-containing protein [Streptomyces sp. 8L]|uniref:DUF397 domain-containing protein n=1 Tax=Streptomyces sp. 8L TaxID=2877242 RepID=UPI001CD4A31D|nr:DUF397 domain-containing protein [Streptomyces sp. 8L]MCA1220713.1 DUF397 domain-containing protein [Streptomyces sp. 8L]